MERARPRALFNFRLRAVQGGGMKGPTFILSNPQLGENIGAAARVMLNFGLTDLRLVAPRDGWPNRKAEAMAAGADEVLKGARVFETIEEAVGDLGLIFATTGRDRLMSKRIATPDEAIAELASEVGERRKCGVLFGAERTGLTNEEIILSDAILSIPSNEDFSSLNLAQSVAVVAYEWWRGTKEKPNFKVPAKFRRAKPAAKEDLIGFFEHIERELDRSEFLFPPAKRAAMVQNMRNMWHRAGLTYQEVQTLRGMVRSLTGGKTRRKKDQR
jgi:tRNA/rRNA methyltransferase